MQYLPLTFVTPYWSGGEMMRIHLDSIRRYHPDAQILVSKRGGNIDEMELYRKDFGVAYWMEDCSYPEAFIRLLARVETDFVCIIDHDVVLLSDLTELLDGLAFARWDLVGIQEQIRSMPGDEWKQVWPESNGWLRFAPGYTDATLLLFNWGAFHKRWGWRGLRCKRLPKNCSSEFHYGICEKLSKHEYLLPFHLRRYGVGNLLKHRNRTMAWHHWYGAYRTRVGGTGKDTSGLASVSKIVRDGEASFLRDYPNVDLSGMVPAWGSALEVETERNVATNPVRFDVLRGVRGWLQFWRFVHSLR